MNQLSGGDNHGSLRDELTRSGGSAGSAFQGDASSFTSDSALSSSFDEEIALHWAAIQRMPTSKRLRSSLFDDYEGNDTTTKRKRVVDVTKLGSLERHLFIDNLIKQIELDNFRLLQKLRKRLDKVGIEFPKVEVRYKNLRIEAECEVVEGKPLPTLWNSFKRFVLDFSRLPGLRSEISRINIIDGISGVIKPGRMTLLLGPPGSGKTSLLKALSGNLEKSFKTGGEISYNGYKLHEFMPQKTSAYISQHDLHMSEMTVRETLNFSSYCQGVGSREEIMVELIRREKEAGILPDPDIDIYMKAISVKGRKAKLQTDYILKILGLDSCADTLVGDVMKRGISGGQKRRLTIGEMIIGPIKALFMDEISNGLDSSTTYQIIACLQHLAHITDATVLVSLLQPAPEVLDLFDDIILLSERKIVYHGPRENVLEFFESCGFRCPERKGTTNFLHEVISKNDQAQYWCLSKERYSYQSVSVLSEKFKESVYGRTLMEQLSLPLAKSTRHKGALIFDMYSLPRWTLFRLCFLREFLLMKRNAFIYVFKTVQLLILASIAITVFLRTRMEKIGLVTANYHMGSLFFSLAIFLVDGLPEGAATVARLAVFNKQRDSSFYPPWAYAIPSVILKVPLSILAAIIWTCLIYFSIGYSLDMWRFFRHLILLFAIHLTSLSMFRFLASITRTIVSSTAACSLALTFCFLFSGFIIPRPFMPNWLKWGFWVSPLTYGEIGLAIDEFSSSTWQKMLPTNSTIGKETLEMHGLNYDEYVFWISIGALFCFTLLFNIGFTLSLSFLKAPVSRAIISRKKFSPMDKFNGSNDLSEKSLHSVPSLGTKSRAGRMILPFQPLTVAFQDLQYSIDNPMSQSQVDLPTLRSFSFSRRQPSTYPCGMAEIKAKKEQGFAHKKLQLLHNITGAFRPRVLTALMGVTGAGKTTLLDVLAGRKTTGIIKGDIRIGGYPKVQKTFARVLGYCEQIDIHSPNITVEESIIFSAWLRLHDQIHFKTKNDFVKEVLETVELDGIKDALVGNPGVTGLSMEQRKRLTIGVELVANPSIMFLDEPTTRLDARAAAIVMRAVKRVADTGRTIVCTIHQPSIEIFESFEEIILLKTGGRMIYCGPLGQHSTKVIEYFESIPGVPNITKNYNPATWLLGVTSSSFEAELGVDFSDTYEHSALCQRNKELVKTLSLPPSSSEGLDFSSRYSQNGWEQFKACLWKQHWSYWRSPAYNLRRIMIMLLLSLLYGGLFLNQGKIHNQQGLFSVLGSMYTAVIFCGVNNTASILPYITSERPVFYRERFAGMYSLWAYALAQVVVEIPYVFVQTIVFTSITYPMIGYHPSAYKVVWYCYMMFCTLLCYSCLGMMIVSITPNYPIAAILQSSFYTMFHLFTGFLIPPQQIPKWWIWLYYITPTSWSLRGLVASQYADIDEEIEVFGVTKTVSSFLREYYGFHHHQLPLIGVILFLFPISFATVYAYCLGNLKFQKR